MQRSSATPEYNRSARVSWTQLLSYGAPALPLAALGLPLYVYLPAFYAEDVGLSLWMVGLLLWVARIFDVVTDPLIGTLSDKLDLPGGRRKPWIVLGVPILIVGCYFLFMPPSDANAAYLLLWSLVTYLGWTMVVLPLSALGAEMSDDYHQRTRITASREGYLIVGTVAAVVIGAALQAKAGPNSAQSGTALAMQGIFILLLISLPLTVALLCWRVPEPIRRVKPASWAEGWPLLKANRPLRRLLFAYFINGLANGFPATLFLIFGKQVLKLSDAQIGIVLVVYFLVGMISLPFWLRLGRKIDKHRLWCAALIIVSVVFVTVPLLGEGDFLWFLLVCVGTGIGLGVDVAAPASIQADVIEHDTANGGGASSGSDSDEHRPAAADFGRVPPFLQRGSPSRR